MKKKMCHLWMLAALWLLLTACGSGEEPGAPEAEEWVYVPEFITLEGNYIDYSRMALVDDSLCYLTMEWNEDLQRYAPCLGSYSLARRKAVTTPLILPQEPSGLNLSQYVFEVDGSLCAIARAYPSEPSADGSSQPRTFLCRFDSQGNCLYARDITEDLQDPSGGQAYISTIKTDGPGRIYLLGNSCLWLYDQEGTLSGHILPPSDRQDAWMRALYPTGDGRMYLSIQTPGVEGRGNTLYQVDFEAKELTEAWADFPDSAAVPGKQTDLLMQDGSGAYTCDLTEKKTDELFRWMDCDINGSDVLYFGEMDDDTIVAVTENAQRQGEIVLLTRTATDKAVQKENLTLAVLSDAYIYEPAVVKFNRSSTRYRITIREYRNYGNGGQSSQADALARLYADISSDNCPDLIELTGLDPERLAAKGVFADLYPFLEKSSLLKAEDFVEEILEAYTFDGVLTSIPALFFLETVMGHSAQLGAEPGWTFDELIALAEANPEAELFDGNQKSDILNYLLLYSQDAFTDWSAGSCSFDSPRFQSLLQFADGFPDGTVPDPDRPGTPALIQSGQVLLKNIYLYDFDSIQMDMAMFGEDAVCIGFPTADGTPRHGLTTAYACAVTSGCQNKEGAWAFIESILAEEENARNQMGFPTLRRRLEAMLEEALQEEYVRDENGELYLDENGNPVITGTETTSGNGWSYTYHTATRQEADMILSLLKDARLTPAPGSGSREIMAIIQQEAEAFFAGHKSLDETTAVIQSRAKLYISENR